jgi:membrane protein DedA with SNARE-associated domain
MTEKILAVVVSFIIAVISASGYAGVALLMAIESACIPLPSEVIMPFAGYLVSTGRFNLFLVATAGAIGCNLGSVVAYWIGAWAGRPFVERFGKYVLVDVHDLDRATHFFDKYGSITVLIGRLLPVFAPSLHCRPGSRGCRSCASTSIPSSAPGHGALCLPMWA